LAKDISAFYIFTFKLLMTNSIVSTHIV